MPLTSKKKKIKIEEAEACDTQALNYTSLLGVLTPIYCSALMVLTKSQISFICSLSFRFFLLVFSFTSISRRGVNLLNHVCHFEIDRICVNFVFLIVLIRLLAKPSWNCSSMLIAEILFFFIRVYKGKEQHHCHWTQCAHSTS